MLLPLRVFCTYSVHCALTVSTPPICQYVVCASALQGISKFKVVDQDTKHSGYHQSGCNMI